MTVGCPTKSAAVLGVPSLLVAVKAGTGMSSEGSVPFKPTGKALSLLVAPESLLLPAPVSCSGSGVTSETAESWAISLVVFVQEMGTRKYNRLIDMSIL